MRQFLFIILFFALKTTVFAQQDTGYRSQGNSNFDKKNYSAARDYYTKAIDSNVWNKSDLAEIYYKRAECSKFLKKFDEAIKDYTAALKYNPYIKNGYWSRAVAYENINDFYECISDYHKAILYVDNDNHNFLGIILNNLSYAAFRLYEIDTAIMYNSAALAQNPNLAAAYTTRGTISMYMKNYPQAIECFSNAIKNIDESDTQILSANYLQRANANQLNKNYKAAVKDCTYVIKLDPDNPGAYWNRADAYTNLTDFKSAIEDYTKTMSFYHNDKLRLAILYKNRGKIKYLQNLFDEAVKDDSVAIALNPDAEQVYTDQALAYGINGNYQAAIKVYHVLISFPRNNNKYNSALYSLMAANQFALGKYEDAASSCSEAISLDAQNTQAFFYRARVFLEKFNNKQQALTDFNRVIALDSTLKTHAAVFSLYYIGKSDQAVQALEKKLPEAINTVAERDEQYDLACLYALMNQPKEANSYLKIAIGKGYSKKYAMADENLINIKNTDDFKNIMNTANK